MTTARRLHHSYEEYLAALEVSGLKLEYCDGNANTARPSASSWSSSHLSFEVDELYSGIQLDNA